MWLEMYRNVGRPHFPQKAVNRWAALKLAEIGTSGAIDILKDAAKNKEIKGNRIAAGVLIRLVKIGKISESEIK